MPGTKNATLRATSVMPNLTVNNLQQSLKFFEGLGFEVEEKWEEDGTLLGVMLKAGEARL
jgi:predicted lactoylglutathione lyase